MKTLDEAIADLRSRFTFVDEPTHALHSFPSTFAPFVAIAGADAVSWHEAVLAFAKERGADAQKLRATIHWLCRPEIVEGGIRSWIQITPAPWAKEAA